MNRFFGLFVLILLGAPYHSLGARPIENHEQLSNSETCQLHKGRTASSLRLHINSGRTPCEITIPHSLDSISFEVIEVASVVDTENVVRFRRAGSKTNNRQAPKLRLEVAGIANISGSYRSLSLQFEDINLEALSILAERDESQYQLDLSIIFGQGASTRLARVTGLNVNALRLAIDDAQYALAVLSPPTVSIERVNAASIQIAGTNRQKSSESTELDIDVALGNYIVGNKSRCWSNFELELSKLRISRISLAMTPGLKGKEPGCPQGSSPFLRFGMSDVDIVGDAVKVLDHSGVTLGELAIKNARIESNLVIRGEAIERVLIDQVNGTFSSTYGNIVLELNKLRSLALKDVQLERLSITADENSLSTIRPNFKIANSTISGAITLPKPFVDSLTREMYELSNKSFDELALAYDIRAFLSDVRPRLYYSGRQPASAAGDIAYHTVRFDAKLMLPSALYLFMEWTTGFGVKYGKPFLCVVFGLLMITAIRFFAGWFKCEPGNGLKQGWIGVKQVLSAISSTVSTSSSVSDPLVSIFVRLIAFQMALIGLFLQNALLSGAS